MGRQTRVWPGEMEVPHGGAPYRRVFGEASNIPNASPGCKKKTGGGRLATPRVGREPEGSGKGYPVRRRGAPNRGPVINRAC